jgi:hypothetical protein
VLGMPDGLDSVIVVVGGVVGVVALFLITVGTLSLVGKRILAHDWAGWKTPGEFGWFSVILGLSQLLMSLSIITGHLGWPDLGGGLAVAAIVPAAAAVYRITRIIRRSTATGEPTPGRSQAPEGRDGRTDLRVSAP